MLTGADLTKTFPMPRIPTEKIPDAPAQEDVFAPDYAPDEIAEIARKLRADAGLA
jgi:hypothetical protein